MLMEKIGLGIKMGKTQQALEQVAEHLLLGKMVVYMTDELSYEAVKERVLAIAEDVPLFNLVYKYNGDLEQIVNEYEEDVVIVVDMRKEMDLVDCNHPLYVYYQTKK